MDEKETSNAPQDFLLQQQERDFNKFAYAANITHKIGYGLFGNLYPPTTSISVADLETEGRRLVETINQSTSIIKIISDKNKIIENNAKYAIHGLKQQLEEVSKELSILKSNGEKQNDKHENMRRNFEELKGINEKLIRKSRQLEIDNAEYSAQNLSLVDEIEKLKSEIEKSHRELSKVKKERDAANYWLLKISDEINSKLVTITQSAEAGLFYDEIKDKKKIKF
jgi:hypothetical protein